MRTIKAKHDTKLKKRWDLQASKLPDNQKVSVAKGKTYKGIITEFEQDPGNNKLDMTSPFSEQHGHFKMELEHNGGTWYFFGEHWQFMDLDKPAPIGGHNSAPQRWEDINWSSMSNPVSKYFTVGEVALNQKARLPVEDAVKRNIFNMAQQMDEIREWWGGPIGINSWYRPWHINHAIGSRAPNHPSGTGVDFRPLAGSVHNMQAKFDSEWYANGRWQGGFGLGARKGFIHLDMRARRKWNY